VKEPLTFARRAITAIVTAIQACKRVVLAAAPRRDTALAPAWSAWECGDFAAASVLGTELVARPETADAGHFMLALVSHVSGD